MDTNKLLLDRLRNILTQKSVTWTEKKMFGGYCFMVDDKMCFGTYKGGLMARVEPDEMDELLTHAGAEQMIHGGRKMTGYAFVQPIGYEVDEDLAFWVTKCLEFNPKAKASKKRKKKKKSV